MFYWDLSTRKQQTDSVKADIQQRAQKESPFFRIFNIVCMFIDIFGAADNRRRWLWK